MDYMVQSCKIVRLCEPKNYTGVAMTANYLSMKYYDHATITIVTGAWAGGTCAVSLLQATNVLAGSAKALGFSYQWTATVAAHDLVKTAVVANTFNLAAANSVHVIEFDAEEMDVDNGFDCFTPVIGTPGANNDFYSGTIVLSTARYQQGTPPAANVN